jgi:hypothetical protein
MLTLRSMGALNASALVAAGILASGIVLAGDGPPSPAGTTRASVPSAATRGHKASLGLEIAELLSIKKSDRKLLPALAEAIKNQDGDAANRSKALTGLVETILAGADPDALVDQVGLNLSIDSKVFPPTTAKDWSIGSFGDWAKLANHLWDLAIASQEIDAAKSSELAKASIMMSAMSDFYTSSAGLVEHMKSSDAEKLLGIPKDRFEKLKEVIKDRNDENTAWLMESIEAYKRIDTISESNDVNIKQETVAQILEHLDKGLKGGPQQLGYRWVQLRITWQFLNLVKSRQSKESQEAVKSQLNLWKLDYGDPNTQRWISEALTRDGPVPGKLHAQGVMK